MGHSDNKTQQTTQHSQNKIKYPETGSISSRKVFALFLYYFLHKNTWQDLIGSGIVAKTNG
jgi:hypothetical protein